MSARVKKRKRVGFGGNKLPHVRSFLIWRSGEGLTSFDKNNCVDLSGQKKQNEGFRGNLIFQNSRKKLLSLNPPNCLFDLQTFNFSCGPLLIPLLMFRANREVCSLGGGGGGKELFWESGLTPVSNF